VVGFQNLAARIPLGAVIARGDRSQTPQAIGFTQTLFCTAEKGTPEQNYAHDCDKENAG